MHVKTRHSYKFYFARLETVHSYLIASYRVDESRDSWQNRAWIIHDGAEAYLSSLCFIYWIRYSIGKREKATIVHAHLVSNIPAYYWSCYLHAEGLWTALPATALHKISLHLDEVDSSHLSTDLPEAVRKLISQLSTLRSSIKINVILSSESSRFSKLN